MRDPKIVGLSVIVAIGGLVTGNLYPVHTATLGRTGATRSVPDVFWGLGVVGLAVVVFRFRHGHLWFIRGGTVGSTTMAFALVLVGLVTSVAALARLF